MSGSEPFWDGSPEEVLINEDVRRALDDELLAWDRGNVVGEVRWCVVPGRRPPVHVSYQVAGRPFAILMEGIAACGLPEDIRSRALTLAGVSPFLASSDYRELKGWVQLLLLLPEDVPAVRPWLRTGYTEIASRT